MSPGTAAHSRPPAWEKRLGRTALAAAVLALAAGLVLAPADVVQGQAQRLMYVHVPAAWTAFAAFLTVLFASVMCLWRPAAVWDRLGRAGAELGVGMTALATALGMLWGRPVWGVWWTWDPRLASTVAMLLVYLAYLAVRVWPADERRRARITAVVGVAGFAVVPVVHFSVLWWRTLHQPPSVLTPPGDQVPVDAPMLAALAAATVAFLLAGTWVVSRRTRALVTAARPVTAVSAARPVAARATAPSRPEGGVRVARGGAG